ncbi:LysR family transcriptional regulator [Pollutimonas harenae]|uniref:LysR family transcriptional regulator n=1 Tax=Pollutimonas harenae TaxID=657015 RepID=A0A853H3C4_9BURK|nr:LysR family transcriptional regulator [Pollutimonas harenae]NYT86530.1 LysR family transcriptional regulator [Pollutimonas harenae]TEA69728.1 LysR family transcriptional regulator [Pollutimonas harenae]
MKIPDLNELYYYAKVVEHGGFAPAGRALGIPKSKLSRRVALLEERLGAQLLLRSTRSFTVTEVGKRYYEHCRAMLTEAEAAEEFVALTHAEPCGVVRISCPVALLAARVGSMLGQFMAQYPRVVLHVDETNRRVDVVGEGMDLAIRVRPPPLQDSDLILRILAERRQYLVAAPELMERCGRPSGPMDLSSWPSLDMGAPQETHRWLLQGPDGGRAEVRLTPRYVTQSMVALRDAAISGVGVVQLPAMFIRDELDGGMLVRVLPDWEPRAEVIHAVYASRRGQLPAVRLLLDFLVQAFRDISEE